VGEGWREGVEREEQGVEERGEGGRGNGIARGWVQGKGDGAGWEVIGEGRE